MKNQSLELDMQQICEIAPTLRMLHNNQQPGIVIFDSNVNIENQGIKEMLYLDSTENLQADFAAFKAANGASPLIVAIKNAGFFSLGNDFSQSQQVKTAFLEAIKSEKKNLGLNLGAGKQNRRLEGRIAIVTGGAQGFGRGIAQSIVAEGGYAVIADLNLEGAVECSESLNKEFGEGRTIPLQVDVSNEESVKKMVKDAVLSYGGLDIMVANAGIVIAGDLTEMTKERLELVTAVNYTGYFLCAKYASVPMKLQSAQNPDYWMDIIEINSKSGLTGSKRNFAYAGSKFGGIGLTQSFALELVEYSIKVNAICPGNLLDGPLWSDPEKGLFKQYLDTGKVKGAKTIEDVRRHYEVQVPMNRGCRIEDVARGIYYLVEQKYETGQALPITGGQVMLK